MRRLGEKEEQLHKISRRAFLLAGGKATLAGLILGRMYYLQISEAKTYALMAEKNRFSWRFSAPIRGELLDCRGEPFVTNHKIFRLVALRESSKALRQSLNALKSFMGLSTKEITAIYKEIRKGPAYIPVIIRDQLSWEDVARLEIHSADFPAVFIEVGHRRVYPYGPMLAPFTGYVSGASLQDQEQDPILKLPGFRVGREGAEKTFDPWIRGTPGYRQLEVDAHNRVVRELFQNQGQPGQELKTTIDVRIQKAAWDALTPHQAGAAVVLDAQTGAIRALASVPTYDPNRFIDGIPHDIWAELCSDSRTPLVNKPISGLYPPASTFKMVVALAALEAGVVTPETRFFCNRVMRVGSHPFHCMSRTGHGSMNLYEALCKSCDIYFYEVALRTGVDRIADMSRRLGLGQVYDFGLAGEKEGLVPDQAWKRRVKNQPWHLGETANIGIGQGYMLTTPLQLAVMTARLASGRMITPHCCVDHYKESEVLQVDPHHLELIRTAMAGVVNDPRGTAFQSKLLVPGEQMAGKTGTCQVKRITLEERRRGLGNPLNRPWHDRDHAIFVGYAPVEQPRYAMAVVVEHGIGGARTAAPIARDIMTAALAASKGH